jgi:hypothetical protein
MNNQLLQFQADILGVAVRRPVLAETTALGAAHLAGLAVRYWETTGELEANWAPDREFIPSIERGERERFYGDWRRAVERSLGWARPREQPREWQPGGRFREDLLSGGRREHGRQTIRRLHRGPRSVRSGHPSGRQSWPVTSRTRHRPDLE